MSAAKENETNGKQVPKNSFQVTQPAITMPKGGGAIRGMGEKFAANPVTGTGSMSVPIATSPGRSGFGPQLSLSYDSGAGNGQFGFGWSLSLPSITRKTDKGLPQYFDAQDSDVFILSGAEDLVPVYRQDAAEAWVSDAHGDLVIHEDDIDGYRVRRYRPRIEGLFARIERWTRVANPRDVHWRSISKDNILTLYGSDAGSRIFNPDDASHIFSWLICETRDDRGNGVLYRYKAEDGLGVDLGRANERNRGARNDARRTANRYLKRIYYGNRTPLLDNAGHRLRFLDKAEVDAQIANASWMFEAVFDYGEHDTDAPKPNDAGAWTYRTDPFSSYRSGFEVRTTRLCQRVLMFHHIPDLATGEKGYEGLVRSTDFTYSHEQDPTSARNPVYTFLRAVIQTGYRRKNGGYDKRSLPPVEFEYTQPVVQDAVHDVNAESLENLPIAVDGAAYQWTDLHGEGIPGILAEQAGAWFYKRNLSPIGKHPVEFAPLELVASKPNLALAGGSAQFMDLASDGQPDLVVMDGPMPGLYEHDEAEGWQPFRPFTSRLNRDMRDPNLKFVDLDGDGHADVLITEDDAFVWHPSLAEEGFGPARRVAQALDEEKGPRLVFADGTQSIYLADLSGDGLSDLVCIRNGEVWYRPNLGYGRFGAKVTMDHAPHFDNPDLFDHKRIRLADVDGSGTTDIIYLKDDGIRLYFNQSGNSWSAPHVLRVFLRVDDVVSIVPTDLLGNGTACLVWSSPLPGDARRPMRYVDLMGGQKPHLLVKTVNNLGAETVVHYAPSTKFYLQDKRDGIPWITRLPFPVHVVEKVETFDHISRNRFATSYAYHHGYFDGEEREFRGFGMVEQRDTEELAALAGDGTLPAATNVDTASHVPPVRTKTWFHTGVYLGRDHVSDFFAGLLDAQDEGEYYREPGLTDQEAAILGLDDEARRLYDDARAKDRLLDDTVLPAGLTLEEEREACRALKGAMLRQEIYALDGTPKEELPYTVAEQNFSVRLEQPRGGNRHAVFFSHPREAITYHYERNPVDPRIQHALTMEVDPFGNVLKSAAIGYGRRMDATEAAFLPEDHEKQRLIHITCTENEFTNATVKEADVYRTPLPAQTRTYELRKPQQEKSGNGLTKRYRFEDILGHINQTGDGVHDIDYEDFEFAQAKQAVVNDTSESNKYFRRLIEQVRTLYRPNGLGTAQNNPLTLLPLRTVESLALPGESYKLAFTPGLLDQVYVRGGQRLLPANPANVLKGGGADRGGYVDLDNNGRWWIPSGRMFHSPDSAHTAVQELAYAWSHFFLPHRTRDPFHTNAVSTESFVTYDAYDLLMLDNRDPLGNRVTVGERLPNGNMDPTKPGNDYRVLQPSRVMDPNRNRTQVAFDILGMVVGTAVMGKPEEVKGDILNGFLVDLPDSAIAAHLQNPLTDPQDLLRRATTRLVYDLFAYQRSKDQPNPRPTVVYTLARETHDSDPAPADGLKIQHSFSYSDGFGREIQKKIQAEPEKVGGVVGPPRWVGSGWIIFNNKGKPVRQYEPFFSTTHRFEFGVEVGVSPILFYDPVERVIATLHPNHTYEKVRFDPWRQVTWDVNDTVSRDPRTDADIQGYTAGYFASQPASPPAPPWQTWRVQRQSGALGTQEQSAASKAASHADTPTTAHFDTLGRPFLTLADNGSDPAQPGKHLFFATRVELDIEGNQRAVRDAIEQAGDKQGRIVMRYAYDMLGNRIHQLSMEAGARWMLNDVSGKPIRAWDSRGHTFRTAYDPLRRPLGSFVTGADPANPNQELLIDRLVYGEQHPEAELRNLRGKLYLHLDQAGSVTTEAHDFKGNPLRATRRLAREYRQAINWGTVNATLPANPTAKLIPAVLEAALAPQLEADIFTSRTVYDALNRPVQMIAPRSDQPGAKRNVIQPIFNEANLLDRVHVWLDHPTDPAGVLSTTVVPPSLVGVNNIDYDAKGQRLRIEYKNGATTRYAYDPETFRLIHLYTRRGATFTEDCENPQPPPPTIAAPDMPLPGTPCGLQNLTYTYDPVGNITHIRDDAQQTIYFRNKRVEPSAEYTYDAIYRLIEATGREHLGQVDGTPIPHSYNDAPRVGIRWSDNDGRAMGTYVERYVYDAVGNFREMQHRGSDPVHPGWTRTYAYSETSLIEDGVGGAQLKTSNRLSSTTVGANPVESCGYDTHGNMLRMPQLQIMQWDYKDQLQMTQRQKVNNEDVDGVKRQGERTYYVYDAAGQRVRKISELANGNLKDERVYIGGFEIYRQHLGTNVGLVRESLHIMDDKQRIALVETRNEVDDGTLKQVIRYQFGNHLGSACLELDVQAQIISYEEDTPYGSTSYQAVRSQTETAKRYRYTGKERDEESGLYYHGARYYAPWMGRWTACDPASMLDSVNLYIFARSNPVKFRDMSGLSAEDFESLRGLLDAVANEVANDKLITNVRKPSGTELRTLPPAQQRVQATEVDTSYEGKKGASRARTHVNSPIQNPSGLGKTRSGDEMAHMAPVRENAKSAIPNDIANAKSNIKAMPAQGKNAEVTRQDGSTYKTDVHAAHEPKLDEIHGRAQAGKTPGTLASSVAAQDAMEEAKILTEPMTREYMDKVEAGGKFDEKAAIEKSPSVQKYRAGKAAKLAEEAPGVLRQLAKGVGGVLLEKGAKVIPYAGTAVGAGFAAHEFSKGNYAAGLVEAAGASEIPIVAQVADIGSLAADVGWVVKDVLDPEQKLEDWYYRTFLK